MYFANFNKWQYLLENLLTKMLIYDIIYTSLMCIACPGNRCVAPITICKDIPNTCKSNGYYNWKKL